MFRTHRTLDNERQGKVDRTNANERVTMKRIIICCDGTWNTPDQKDRGALRPTNVVKMARIILPQATDGCVQGVYYDRGVGTGDFIDRLFGGAFGVGLKHNVVQAYRHICEQYDAGDEIWFFGFSRGAYTARRAAGMIRKCGLVPRTASKQQMDEAMERAYEIFIARETAEQAGVNSRAARLFREAFASIDAPIHFIGVWDTVGAYGIGGTLGFTAGLSKARFHDSILSSRVKFAYHALAIDEKRLLFRPTLWQQSKEGRTNGQVMEQAWFAGVHSNVGGGYSDAGLSDITLTWMGEKAAAAGLCMARNWQASLSPDIFGELRQSDRGIYRLMPDAVREIGARENSNEKLHISAFDRSARDPAGYKPPNLETYLLSAATQIDESAPV